MKLAILGCGRIAQQHLPAMKRAGFEISEAASTRGSRSLERFCKSNKIGLFYSDPSQLLSSRTWDALLITVPTSFSCSYLALLKNDARPILIEKPVAHESARLTPYLESKNIVVGYNRRFYPTIERLRELLPFDLSDCLISVSIPETSQSVKNFPSINRLNYYTYENSVHIFDLLNFLMGPIKWIHCETNRVNKHDPPSLIVSYAHGGRGARIFLDINYDCPDNFSIQIKNAKFRLVLCPLEVIRQFSGMEIQESTPSHPLKRYVPTLVEERFAQNHEIKAGFLEQALQFYRFCATGDRGRLASIRDAAQALKLVEQLNHLSLIHSMLKTPR